MHDTPLDTLELVGDVSADLVLSTVLLVELGGGRVPRGIKLGLPSLFGTPMTPLASFA